MYPTGGIPKVVSLEPPQFKIDPAKLRAAFSPKTKLIIFNSPHNPTSHCATAEELELIGSLCIEFDSLALYDEVYETVVYALLSHRPLFKTILTQENLASSCVGPVGSYTSHFC